MQKVIGLQRMDIFKAEGSNEHSFIGNQLDLGWDWLLFYISARWCPAGGQMNLMTWS